MAPHRLCCLLHRLGLSLVLRGLLQRVSVTLHWPCLGFAQNVVSLEDAIGLKCEICSGVGLWQCLLRLPGAVRTDSQGEHVWRPYWSPHLLSLWFDLFRCLCWLLPAAQLRNAAYRKLSFQRPRRHPCSTLLPAL